MGVWILLAIALVLLCLGIRERYVVISGPGVRPSKTAEWLSKIDAEAPIGANDDDYIVALQQFYDQIYKPARTANPDVFIPDTEVKTFAEANQTLDKHALRRIIAAGFAVERTGSAAIREQEQLVNTGALVGFKGEALAPEMGKGPFFERSEPTYTPADLRKGNLPEGLYKPVDQQDAPRREGDYDNKSISWTGTRFYNVCDGEECAKNVL